MTKLYQRSLNCQEFSKFHSWAILVHLLPQIQLMRYPETGATLVRFNGQNALAFQVIKRGNANTLEVVSRVEKEVQKLRSTPEGCQTYLSRYSSKIYPPSHQVNNRCFAGSSLVVYCGDFSFFVELASNSDFRLSDSHVFVGDVYRHGDFWF